MTQQDKWIRRTCVTGFWDYKKELKILWGTRAVPECLHLVFYLPMPASWSNKKKSAKEGTPHRQRPDSDNLLKGFLDALLVEDSHIWDTRVTKYWGRAGKIVAKPLLD